MNLELINRKNAARYLIDLTHMKLLSECLARWKKWRPSDHLDELRRLYLLYHPNHLGPTVVEDPVFLLRSIQNTQREVFPEINSRRDISIARIMAIRNASHHDGTVKSRTSSGASDNHELNDEDVRYLTDCCDYLIATICSSTAPVVQSPVVQSPVVQSPVVQSPVVQSPVVQGLPQVLSFYVLCDTSTSMFGRGIDAVNRSIKELHGQLLEDPVISDKVRIAMLSFATDARVELPLSRPSDIATMPTFSASGVTNYSRVFDLVGDEISRNMATLRTTHRPLRPVVFIVTDGSPTDKKWLESLDKLVDTSNPYVPNVVVFPCGFDATELEKGFTNLSRGLAPRIWSIDPNRLLEDAIREAISSVTKSIVQTATGDGDTLVISGS
jgi:uncharacterized protein YegL